jgi:hypothetical protein
MSQRNILKIIENEIQELHIERKILYNNYENIIRELGEHLKLMEMPDDRQINKISVVHRIDDPVNSSMDITTPLKKTLAVWLKDDVFHIDDDELRTDDQKKRFRLEVERAEIIEKIIKVDNEFAKKNQQVKIIDPTRDFSYFGLEDWDLSSLDLYGKIASLEIDLRNWIHDVYRNKTKNYWKDPDFISSLGGRFEKINENYDITLSSYGVSMLRKIDFLDFSDYESILKVEGKQWLKNNFFHGSIEEQRKMISNLSEIRELRNKIMHRPPLNDQERKKFDVFYDEIIKIIDKSKQEI